MGTIRAIGRSLWVTITSAPFSTALRCSESLSFNWAIFTVIVMAISSHIWPCTSSPHFTTLFVKSKAAMCQGDYV